MADILIIHFSDNAPLVIFMQSQRPGIDRYAEPSSQKERTL
jgi:hypothetical protein